MYSDLTARWGQIALQQAASLGKSEPKSVSGELVEILNKALSSTTLGVNEKSILVENIVQELQKRQEYVKKIDLGTVIDQYLAQLNAGGIKFFLSPAQRSKIISLLGARKFVSSRKDCAYITTQETQKNELEKKESVPMPQEEPVVTEKLYEGPPIIIKKLDTAAEEEKIYGDPEKIVSTLVRLSIDRNLFTFEITSEFTEDIIHLIRGNAFTWDNIQTLLNEGAVSVEYTGKDGEKIQKEINYNDNKHLQAGNKNLQILRRIFWGTKYKLGKALAGEQKNPWTHVGFDSVFGNRKYGEAAGGKEKNQVCVNSFKEFYFMGAAVSSWNHNPDLKKALGISSNRLYQTFDKYFEQETEEMAQYGRMYEKQFPEKTGVVSDINYDGMHRTDEDFALLYAREILRLNPEQLASVIYQDPAADRGYRINYAAANKLLGIKDILDAAEKEKITNEEGEKAADSSEVLSELDPESGLEVKVTEGDVQKYKDDLKAENKALSKDTKKEDVVKALFQQKFEKALEDKKIAGKGLNGKIEKYCAERFKEQEEENGLPKAKTWEVYLVDFLNGKDYVLGKKYEEVKEEVFKNNMFKNYFEKKKEAEAAAESVGSSVEKSRNPDSFRLDSKYELDGEVGKALEVTDAEIGKYIMDKKLPNVEANKNAAYAALFKEKFKQQFGERNIKDPQDLQNVIYRYYEEKFKAALVEGTPYTKARVYTLMLQDTISNLFDNKKRSGSFEDLKKIMIEKEALESLNNNVKALHEWLKKDESRETEILQVSEKIMEDIEIITDSAEIKTIREIVEIFNDTFPRIYARTGVPIEDKINKMISLIWKQSNKDPFNSDKYDILISSLNEQKNTLKQIGVYTIKDATAKAYSRSGEILKHSYDRGAVILVKLDEKGDPIKDKKARITVVDIYGNDVYYLSPKAVVKKGEEAKTEVEKGKKGEGNNVSSSNAGELRERASKRK